MGNWIVPNVTFVSLVAASPLKQPTSLFARGQSGKVSTREFNTKGWVWEETYRGRMGDPDMQAFLTRMTRAVTKGEILTGKQHPWHNTLLGEGGNLTVSGSGQSGEALIIAGAGSGSTVLKAGDMLTIAPDKTVYRVVFDVVANTDGGATASLTPAVFSGSIPPDSASLVLTDNVVHSVIIDGEPDVPVATADQFIDVTIFFRESL